MDRLLLVVALALTQAQTAPATTTPVSRDELKKSLDRFTGELEKTKSEAESVVREMKEAPPKSKVKLVIKPVRRRERVVKKKKQTLSVPTIPMINTVTPDSHGELIMRPIIPTVKVVKKPSEPKPATRPGKSFWKKVWHLLPFRFFGEH